MYYKLIRTMPRADKGVAGKLYRVSHYFNKRSGLFVERMVYLCETLENADYLIPALVYKIQVTLSPKFHRLLPCLVQVPGRSGIRVHRGALPAHSKGCILVSASDEKTLTARWLREQSNHEEIRIEICNNINYYRQ